MVLVARVCPILDIDCFSLYLTVHFYLNACDTCVQRLYAIFRNDTGYPEVSHLFRKCLGIPESVVSKTANGM